MSNVSLVAVSEPRIEEASNLKELIVYCARVSNPSNQANMDTADKLFDYLLREKHFSPFEMVHVTMEINTSRDIARQILRHRSFSFQEFSQRYAEVDTLEPVLRDARLQDHKNRQNSIETDNFALQSQWYSHQMQTWDTAVKNYKEALKKGIAKEQARALLPEGMTPSRLYMAGSIRSWLHYIEVREGNGTQREHIDIALQCKEQIMELLK